MRRAAAIGCCLFLGVCLFWAADLREEAAKSRTALGSSFYVAAGGAVAAVVALFALYYEKKRRTPDE